MFLHRSKQGIEFPTTEQVDTGTYTIPRLMTLAFVCIRLAQIPMIEYRLRLGYMQRISFENIKIE